MAQTVVVLGGGSSPEREVSLRSAQAVTDAARAAGFSVAQHDPAHGQDFLQGLDPESVVLPMLHGVGGEDGQIQTVLERQGLRYLGSNAEVSAICFDKARARDRMLAHDIPMPHGAAVTRAEYQAHVLAKQPHVLKVARGGSSIGLLIAHDPASVSPKQIDAVFDLDNKAILEELVEGTEITVPILDTKALPVIEIRPPYMSDFDFENKYNGKTEEICPPRTVSVEVQAAAQTLAEKVHAVMGCRHYSRVDMIVRPSGDIEVLEINTIPGMTNQSLFPRSAAVAGLSMPDLVQKFIGLVRKG